MAATPAPARQMTSRLARLRLIRRRRRALLRPRQTQLPRILIRTYVAGGALLALILFGTAGFYFGAAPTPPLSDAFFMTMTTITTVGYGEIVRVDTFPERLFAGLLGVAGFGTLTFLFTSLTVFFLEVDLDYTLRRRRMEKSIKKLRNHYIICGFGRVGRNVAQELFDTGRHFVAIDSEEAQLSTQRERLPGLLYFHGDASDDDILAAANIEDARGVFAVTGDDSRNLMISLTAKQLNPRVRVVARCHETRNIGKIRKAGADTVVSPDFTGGMRIASAMVRPNVVSFLDEMLKSEHRLRLEEVVVPEGFPARALGSLLAHHADYVLLAVRTRADWIFNPPAEFELKPGYTLIAMATPHGRQEIETALMLQ
jgi:voltage-gated potassium channel